MKTWLIVIAISYLLGSIPFGYLLVRLFRKQDIRAVGSGNIGATNVIRSGAKWLGALTLLLDLLKGLVAVLFAFQIAVHSGVMGRAQAYDLAVVAAVAAVCGHVFPVWLGFKGGKGVATALGVFLGLLLPAALSLLVLFVVVVWFSRFISLGSIVAAAAFPVIGIWMLRGRLDVVVVFGFVAIPALVIAKHHENIRRLLAGTEHRFGASRSKVAA
jgi:glycerol-3-phosphate acyltransferase PlsY